MRQDRCRPLLAILALVLFLTACGGDATPTATVQPTAVPQAAAAATAPNTPAITPSPTMPPPSPTATVAPSPTAASSPTAAVPAPTVAPTPTPEPAPTATPAPATRAGLPVRLRIPAIKVDAAVEQVGLTPEGAMDVPKEYANVGWFNQRARPGEPGNAVVAGHVDSKTGKAVFWDVKKLKPGDEIVVAGDDGVERRFVVESSELYKGQEAPLGRIFGPTSDTRLTLITCEGVFDRRAQEYDSRRVIYAKAAS